MSDEVLSEPVFHERESKQVEEKIRIGERVASLIDNNDTIILDSGTTTLRIAELLSDKIGLTVITNDINIATTLRFSKSIKVIVTGGVLFPDSFMLNGMITNDILKNLNVNKAFIGTPAIHHQKGLTHFDDYLVQAKKEMIKSAKQVFVAADHTKFGRVSLHNVANISEIHGLITGNEAKEEILEHWGNVEVFLA
ncbi:DeoR/GlpR family DNA-binding transcription regulator [Gracilibacillus alcaliphilus]|uniref:DeoR/GlpR family DNA-binding transcription regulator n=1 Tax=Gracilibacillus alcaliphilus TaxID=1401441 RepID=UPI00195B627B|nr:DeoR/GlpR family DNA-binding transcription regulator [Gracilibacillus alcaliphilus]MBM7679608.1 DeoR/GlpR family transcriptional regulator of sugar metabolism [Gracilibacillus alcaliphilus]